MKWRNRKLGCVIFLIILAIILYILVPLVGKMEKGEKKGGSTNDADDTTV